MGASIIVGVKGKALGYSTPSSGVEGASTFEDPLTEKTSYIFQILTPLALGFVKCSILLFYRRIFCAGIGIRDPFDLTTRIMLFVLVLWGVAFSLAFGFICGLDFSENWTPVNISGDQCPNPIPLLDAYVISDAILDLGLLIMPVPLIWKMQMPIRKRLTVASIFLLGTMAIVASLMQMILDISSISEAVLAYPFIVDDPNLLTSRIIYWGMLEMGLAVIVACLPTLQSLVRKTWPLDVLQNIGRFLSSRSQGSSRSRSFQTSEGHPASSQAELTGHLSAPKGTFIIQGTFVIKDLERQWNQRGVTSNGIIS